MQNNKVSPRSGWLRTLAGGLLATLATALHAAPPLPPLGAPAELTVSGISSGGYMAVQYHVAHARTVRGAGVLAAGPYLCAGGSTLAAMYNCMNPGAWTPLPATATLHADTRALAARGRIDDPAALAGSRVWLFSGTRDATVSPGVVQALADYYKGFVRPGDIHLENTVAAGHAMITTDYGGACNTTASPYINDCDFDAAHALLQHLLGPLAPAGADQDGQLISFDQKEFTAGQPGAIALDDSGYAYIPNTCRAGGCRVHIAFHGCRQGAETLGDTFARHAGYNRWAASNRLIILYPQAIPRHGWGNWSAPNFVYNPRGCWDWWGYTGSDYASRNAPQIKAIRAMVDRLTTPP